MKKYIIYLSVAVLALVSSASCQKDVLSDTSVIKVQSTVENQFDKWLNDNFLTPYNIEIKYRFEMGESDMNYYTVPAAYDDAIKMAHLVKYLCVDTYDEVAGINFTRGNFPKMFFFIGEWEYRNNGTFILGTAEGGKKILLSGLNYVQPVLDGRYDMSRGPAEGLNHYYIKTIHHEFTHILNQTKNYPTDFAQVTGSGYVADSWSEEPFDREFLQNGFISAYAQQSDGEDFAETVSIYVTNPQSYWDAQVAAAGAEAGALINEKLEIASNYMRDSWGIELNQLRSTILRRQEDVISGKIDLTDITVK